MDVSDFKWNPTDNNLRCLAGVWLLIFGGLGTYWYVTSGLTMWSWVTGALAGVAGLGGLAFPQTFKDVGEINWNPTGKELRNFAGLCLLFFGGVGAYWYTTSGLTVSIWVIWALGGGLGLVGLAVPRAIKWVFVGWIVAVFPIGWTISHLLLGAIFYFLFAPIGWTLRTFGHDPMNRKIDPSAQTYWIRHEQRQDPASYFRQY